MVKKILWKIWFIYASFIFALVMFICFPLSAVSLVFKGKTGTWLSCFFLKTWGFLFSFLIGIWYRTNGKENIPSNSPAVFIANHRSFLDTPAAYLSIPVNFKPLGKVEMKKVPFFGWFYPKVVVMVDRKSMESKKKSMDEMKKNLRQGTSIFIFPEGSMNRTEQPLTHFYEGAFHLAIEMQVPVIPLIISNTASLLPPYQTNTYPGVVNTCFLEPVSTKGLQKSDIPSLKEKVYQIMKNALEDQDVFQSQYSFPGNEYIQQGKELLKNLI